MTTVVIGELRQKIELIQSKMHWNRLRYNAIRAEINKWDLIGIWYLFSSNRLTSNVLIRHTQEKIDRAICNKESFIDFSIKNIPENLPYILKYDEINGVNKETISNSYGFMSIKCHQNSEYLFKILDRLEDDLECDNVLLHKLINQLGEMSRE